LGVVLLQPDSRGHIRLASANPTEPPVIDPDYLTAESDLRRLVAGIRIAERLCDAEALRPYVGHPMPPWPGKLDDASLARLVREHAQTAYHPVGTCRMGGDDAAVVDCELRVRGLDGLRVVDAPPTSSERATTSPNKANRTPEDGEAGDGNRTRVRSLEGASRQSFHA
jgi:choline dehydrogenase